MRQLIAVLLLVAPAFAAAQSVRPPAEPSQTPTLPPIGLPLAPIGLPLSHLGLPPAHPTPTQSSPAPAKGPQRGDGDGRRGRSAPEVVYVVPGYGWGMTFPATTPEVATTAAPVASAAVAKAPVVPSPAATGTLRLDLQPSPTGQLFVEGAYVGTLDELGLDLTFATGTHRLEIREHGYEPLTLAVRIDAGRHLVYRGMLTKQVNPPASPGSPAPTATPAPAAADSASPAPPVARKLFYFIPGCYLGDVPPKDAGLPATCDQSRTVTFRP